MKVSDYVITVEIELSTGKKISRDLEYTGINKSEWQKVLKSLPISNHARCLLRRHGEVELFIPDVPDWREHVTYTIKELTPTHSPQNLPAPSN